MAAGFTATVIVAVAVSAVPFGQVQLPANPSFLPAFGALTFLTELLTATLLLSQAVVARDRGPLRLGAAYLFSGLALVPYLLAFPGVLTAAPLIGGPDSAVWLWAMWHGGLAIHVMRFVLGRPARLRQGDVVFTVLRVGAIVAGLAAVATLGADRLPRLLVDGNYDRFNTLGFGPAILGLTVVTGLLAIARLRLRDPLSLWLAISLLAAGLDVTLTLTGRGRFTFGWYVARGLSLTTGVTMLVALLSELIVQAGRVATLNGQLELMLCTDTLTGLHNRRAFDLALDVEWRRGRREATALSLLVIDIDLFKGFNDRHGHPAGDCCLRQVAQVIAAEVQRPGDLPARIGGEEFVVLLPCTEEAGALRVAERIRAAVEVAAISYAGRTLGTVTVSIGAATRRPSDRAAGSACLMDAADNALYRAKRTGRDRVCCDQVPLPLLAVA